ncbi:unnamed protein product [Coregonus sp. 'balchen']|nr:unnamed protein product [Coregonus sp. 'balchen']
MRRSEIHAAESVECLNRALNRLKDIWEEIGIPEDQRLQRTDVVKKHIKGLLDMMIAEEDSLRKRLMSSIESCRKELDVLCTELQLSPFEEDEGRTMLQLEKDIRSRLEVTMKQKSQRVKELKTLSKQDRELCDIMCSVPFCIDVDAVPSLEQLDGYRSYLNDLTKEKDRRHSEFVGIKRQIMACMEELDQLPDTSFERDVLEDRKTENELVCNSYRSKIQELWERLGVPQEEREAMSEHVVQSRKKNMEALEAECRRLEELKMRNMRNVIEAVRAELEKSLKTQIDQWEEEQYRDFLLNATSSISGSTPNSTLRSAFGGTMCQSPVPRLPTSVSKRTPSRVGRTPRTLERNKENVSHPNAAALSSVFKTPARSPASRRNISINTVAGTYSEFSVISNPIS